MRARYYDSGSARFLSRDPIGSLDPRAINPYQYAKDSPLRNADPTGLQSTTTTFPIAPGLTATVTTTKGDLGTHYDVTLSANGKPYQRIRAFYDKQGNLLFSKTETLSMGELKVAETFVSTGATSEQLAASIHEDSDPVTALISQISEGLAAPVAQINPPLTSIATASLSYNPVCINTKPASGGETSAQMSALDSMVVSESTIGQTPAYFDFDAFDIEPLKVRTDNQLHPIPPIHSILSMSPLLFNQ
jgi:hypothetical protein